MPPKTTYEKKEILNIALKLLQNKGFNELTARKIAEELNTSTAPIYTYFSSIDSLKREVLKNVSEMILDYSRKSYTKNTALNCGIGFVLFARDYPILFRVLFLENTGFKDIIENLIKALREIMFSMPKLNSLKNNEKENIYINLWISTYGLATLACVGLLEDNSEEYIIGKLREISLSTLKAAVDLNAFKDK